MPKTHETPHYDYLGGHFTLITAQGFIAAEALAHDGVRVFHRR